MYSSLPSSCLAHCALLLRPARFLRPALLGGILAAAGVLGACRQPAPPVESHLQGRVTVDSTRPLAAASAPFHVLVSRPQGRRLDTLGYAQTGPQGHFQMSIQAPRRGLYALSVRPSHTAQPVRTTEYIVAHKDSATLTASVSRRDLSLRPTSPENRALRAYRSTQAVRQRLLVRQRRRPFPDSTAQTQGLRFASSTLWALRTQHPGTYAAQFAAVESLAHLEGWNDSLALARARHIPPTSPFYVSAARIARRAMARQRGHRAALALVDSFQARAPTAAKQAGIEAVRIQAFLDSLQHDAALAASQRLRADHPHSPWARWARRTQHMATRLRRGHAPPSFRRPTLQGDTVSLRALQGRPVVLEYYRPGTDRHALQRPLRNALYRATRPDSVAFVSVSVEPDSFVTRAFLHRQTLPGHALIAAQGLRDSIVSRYNVVQPPVWFLLDAAGTLVGRYRASDIPRLQHHLLHRTDQASTPGQNRHARPQLHGVATRAP